MRNFLRVVDRFDPLDVFDSLVDTFDGTLVARGQTELVARERKVKSGGAGDAIARLGKLVSKPFEKGV